jgi:hypothetical protein
VEAAVRFSDIRCIAGWRRLFEFDMAEEMTSC